MKLQSACAAIAAMTVFMLAATANEARAGAKDFDIQAVTATVKSGEGADLAIKIVNTTTGKLVEGAVVFRTRLDMSPDSMAEMEAKLVAQPATEPGVYRFKADLTMAGSWALKVMAKVPGEADTIEGTVIFKAKE